MTSTRCALLHLILLQIATAVGASPTGSCNSSSLPQEQVMLQMSSSRAAITRHGARMEFGKVNLECREQDVSRRRRDASMCACRRRSGPSCKNAAVSLEPTPLSIKMMSYNLMGWNAFGLNKWRGINVMKKISSWNPDVLGAQEIETGGGQGYDTVKEEVKGGTGLAHAGGGQFYNASSLEKLDDGYTELKGGYWMSMTQYRHKESGFSFLYFNSHWKHGYGTEQAEIVASFIDARRREYGNLPVVLVGDTNQFCNGYERSAWKYLKGEQGSSPVLFEDVLQHDQGKSFSDINNPDCRVDLIFVSKGDWFVRQSDIDRDGMGARGDASDHAPLMAELTPL